MTTTDMHDRVCMVTGANQGMGKATALALAKLGTTVVMVCRDAVRGEAAVADVKAQSGNDNVELFIADLSSQQSIRHAAQEFLAKHNRLHVLVNNAGVFLGTRSVTVDGLETTFATNHLGPFLLTNLLLPVLKNSVPARIITVSSGAQGFGKINFDNLQSEKQYGQQRVYAQSKLANVLFTYELARRLEGTGVTANCLEPGFVKTNMTTALPKLFKLLVPLFATPIEKGASAAIYLATSSDIEGISGKFYNSKSVAVRSSKDSHDKTVAQRLWQVSEQLTQLIPEKV